MAISSITDALVANVVQSMRQPTEEEKMASKYLDTEASKAELEVKKYSDARAEKLNESLIEQLSKAEGERSELYITYLERCIQEITPA